MYCCCKNKALCIITGVLLFVGGLNWGLVGLGNLLTKNLNVVNLLLGQWPTAEWVVYLIVGLAAIVSAICAIACKGKCECEK